MNPKTRPTRPWHNRGLWISEKPRSGRSSRRAIPTQPVAHPPEEPPRPHLRETEPGGQYVGEPDREALGGTDHVGPLEFQTALGADPMQGASLGPIPHPPPQVVPAPGTQQSARAVRADVQIRLLPHEDIPANRLIARPGRVKPDPVDMEQMIGILRTCGLSVTLGSSRRRISHRHRQQEHLQVEHPGPDRRRLWGRQHPHPGPTLDHPMVQKRSALSCG